MKITLDTDTAVLSVDGRDLGLYSREAFDVLNDLWTVVGWQQKYSYRFRWFGQPIIQLPEDVIRVQEAIYTVRPDLVIECGVAHGGSLLLYASLMKAMGGGRVIGVDVEIRPHNRAALEAHELFGMLDLVEGDSTAPGTVAEVHRLARSAERTIVLLDSNHTHAHVLAELEAYHDLVTPGSYLVVADGVMRAVADVPNGRPEWKTDNPLSAVEEFLDRHDHFEPVTAPQGFDESDVERDPTYWPGGWLRRRD